MSRAVATAKAHPTDVSIRTALFELSCFAGAFERAEKQLDLIGHFETALAFSTAGYRSLIDAERHRERVLRGEDQPEFVGDPAGALTAQLEAVAAWARGEPGATFELLEAARPRPRGTIDGHAFADLRDGDDRLASVLEAHVAGKYTWLAWEQVRFLSAKEPEHLRDLFWRPAIVGLTTGEESDVHLPVLYAESHAAEDPRARLGHLTTWDERSGCVCGVGRKTFFTGDGEFDAVTLRELRIADATS